MKKTILVLLVLIAMSAFALWAGGEQEARAGETVLKVLVYDDPWFDDIFADFESRNPGITVERKRGQAIDTGAITSMLSSDNSPDILLVNSGPGRIGPLSQAGLLEDLTGYYSDRGWEKTVTPAIMDILKKNGHRLWEVNNGMDIFQVYYRKSLFKQAGVNVPTSWADYIQCLNKLKSSGIQPIALGVRDNYQGGWFMGTVFQASAGLDLMTDVIYGNGKYTNPKVVRGADTVTMFVQKGYISKDAPALSANEARTLFATGQAAMIVAPQGNIAQTINDGILDPEDLGSFLMPSMDGGKALPTSGLSQSWIMSRKSSSREAAFKFLDYVASPEYMRKLAELNAWSYGVAAVSMPRDVELEPIIQNAIDSIANGAGYNPSVFVAAPVKTVYYAQIQSLLSLQVTPEESMAAIQRAKDEL